MMICPTSYLEKHRNDSFEELIQEREGLLNSIKKYENIVLYDKDRKSEAWDICPGPDVIYQVKLGYLTRLCNFMQEKYNKERVRDVNSED